MDLDAAAGVPGLFPLKHLEQQSQKLEVAALEVCGDLPPPGTPGTPLYPITNAWGLVRAWGFLVIEKHNFLSKKIFFIKKTTFLSKKANFLSKKIIF